MPVFWDLSGARTVRVLLRAKGGALMELPPDDRRRWGRMPGKIRERERREREAPLVPVDCPRCDVFLAEIPLEAEVRCPTCHRWIAATAVPKGVQMG